MKDVANWALNVATMRGATYADARIADDRSRALATKNGKIGSASDSESLGIGVRVIANGAWGFAASDDDGLASIFAAKMGDMARRYQDGSEPDVTKASLAELFAWCLARPGQGSPAPGISSA